MAASSIAVQVWNRVWMHCAECLAALMKLNWLSTFLQYTSCNSESMEGTSFCWAFWVMSSQTFWPLIDSFCLQKFLATSTRNPPIAQPTHKEAVQRHFWLRDKIVAFIILMILLQHLRKRSSVITPHYNHYYGISANFGIITNILTACIVHIILSYYVYCAVIVRLYFVHVVYILVKLS